MITFADVAVFIAILVAIPIIVDSFRKQVEEWGKVGK